MLHELGDAVPQLFGSSSEFFTKDAHLDEVTSPVSSGDTVANEVGAIFSAMLTGRRSPLSLMAL